MRKRRFIKHLTQSITLALLIGLTLLVLHPIQHTIETRVNALKEQITVFLENRIDRTIQYSSISPSLFSFIEIRNLEIYQKTDPHQKLVSIESLHVHYNLFTMLFRPNVGGFYKISARNSSVSIDTSKDADIVTLLREVMQLGGKASEITLSGKNISIETQTDNGTYSARNVFFHYTMNGSTVRFSVRAKTDIRFSEPIAGFGHVNTSLIMSGKIAKNLKWSDIDISFSSFHSNFFSLDKQTFHVTVNQDYWEIWKIQDRLPVNLQIIFDPESQVVQASFLAERFEPRTLINVEEDMKHLEPWLSTMLSGSGSIQYDFKAQTTFYTGDVTAIVENNRVPTPLRITGDYSGNSATAQFDNLTVSTDYGTIDFNGSIDLQTLYPSGTVSLYAVNVPTGDTLNGQIQIEPNGDRITFFSKTLNLGDNVFFDTELSVLPYHNSYDFRFKTSLDSDAEHIITLDGNVDTGSNPFIQLSGEVQNIPLENMTNVLLADTVKIPKEFMFLNRFHMNAELFCTTDLKNFSFVLPSIELLDPTDASTRVAFGLSGNNESIEISNMDIAWDDYEATGNVTSSFSETGEISFSSSFVIEDYPYTFTGMYVPDESLQISGNYGLEIAVTKVQQTYTVNGTTRDFPVPFTDTIAEISLDTRGFYISPDNWEVILEHVSFANLPILAITENSIEFTSRVTPEKVTIYNMQYNDDFSALLGNGEFTYEIARELRLNGWVQLANQTNDEFYNAVFEYRNRGVDAQITFNESPLDRFQGLPVSGNVTGQMNVSGDLPFPDIRTTIALTDGQLNTDPFSFSASITMGKSIMDISELEIQYLSNTISGGSGRYLLNTGKFSFTSSFSTIFQIKQFRTAIAMNGEASAISDRSDLNTLIEKDFSGEFHLTDVTYGERELSDWNLTFFQKNQVIDVQGGPENALYAQLFRGGTFNLNLARPLPVVLKANGTIKEASLDSSLTIDYFDIEAFNTFLNIPFFNLKRGMVFGNVTITGPLNDPDINGTLEVNDATAINPLVPTELGPFDSMLVFNGKNFTIPTVGIPVENKTVNAQCDFIIDHWIPSEYDIELTTSGDNQVPLKSVFGRVAVDGYCSGRLHIVGDFSQARLSGDLRATQTTITIAEAQLGKERKSQFSYSVDLSITSERQVEFLWPTQDFPILRTYAETGETLHVEYDSGNGTMRVDGEIDIRSGQVYYFSRSFYLKEGRITFNENQNRFDPVLAVAAELREISVAGEDVTIRLVVDNKPFSRFTPRFESEPHLSNTEIFALLGQNVITEFGGEQIDLPSAIVHTGGFLFSQLGFLRTFEQKVKEVFKLDLFSIRTQMLENLLLAGVFGNNASQPQTTNPFGRYLDNTTLFLGKYLSEDLFLEAMVSLRLKDISSTNMYQNEEFTIDTEISLEWNTPLALLELTLIPNVQHFLQEPLGLKLALSWGFSF